MALRILIGCHVLAGLTATLAGAAAMLAPKRPGRHPRRGRLYLIALTALVVTGFTIALTNWTQLWRLAALGTAATILAGLGYTARRIRYPGWLPVHITGMAGAYIAMLTAFYVDNGPRLPLWNLLPPLTFWYLPAAIGIPLLARALHRHRRAMCPGECGSDGATEVGEEQPCKRPPARADAVRPHEVHVDTRTCGRARRLSKEPGARSSR